MCPSAGVRRMLLALLLLLLQGLLAVPVLARSADAEQPVHIESDRAELDKQAGVGRYIGNVRITQGSMRINAAELRIFIAGNRIDQMIASGAPVTLRQVTDDGREIQGKAQRIVYRAKANEVSLERRAELWQGGNRFASEKITYNINTGVVTAGTGQAGERVEVLIQPNAIETTRSQQNDKPPPHDDDTGPAAGQP